GLHQRILLICRAEDGIRAFHVTGVQTCALPISKAVPTSNLPAVPTRVPGSPPRRFTRQVWNPIGQKYVPLCWIPPHSLPLTTHQIGRASCRKECRSRRLKIT